MNEAQPQLAALAPEVMSTWHRWLDVFEPLRPTLYRYCRHLTRSPWDAEDLVQDALMRAFVTLGTVYTDLPNPQAWLVRVATNLWIDRARRARLELEVGDPAAAESPTGSDEVHAAGRVLFAHLAPQERAAVVLKDVFDFSLHEIAETLATTTGAVKAALHRGRGRIREAPEAPAGGPVPPALAAFSEAFNARDLERMTDLLLESATVEIVGVVTEFGREAPKDARTGSFAGTLSPITYDERGGVPPELLVGYLGTAPRSEVRAWRDGWMLLFWYEHEGGPLVRTVMTVEALENRIARVRNYFFTPDVIAEVCTELGVPFRVNGYRYWHQA